MPKKSENHFGKMVRQKRPKGKDGECKDFAVVRVKVNGKTKSVYLGKWGSKEADDAYRRLAAEYYSSEGSQAAIVEGKATLYDVYNAFLIELEKKSDPADRRCYKNCIWYGMSILPDIPADELDLKHLALYQKHLIHIANDVCDEIRNEDGELIQKKKKVWSRQTVCRMVKYHKAILKFGITQGLIPHGFLWALKSTAPIREQEGLKETDPVVGVENSVVLETLPFFPAQVADMILIIRGASLRPVECCRLRKCDLDTSGPCWRGYVKSKTTWRGLPRYIAFSPAETAILKKWSDGKADTDYIFSPEGENRQWLVTILARHVRKAIKVANKSGYNIPHWTLYQLRHQAYTENADKFGVDVASKVAGNRVDQAAIYDHSVQRVALHQAENRQAWWE